VKGQIMKSDVRFKMRKSLNFCFEPINKGHVEVQKLPLNIGYE